MVVEAARVERQSAEFQQRPDLLQRVGGRVEGDGSILIERVRSLEEAADAAQKAVADWDAAVPIGGKYRLIDIPISNCINSGLAW